MGKLYWTVIWDGIFYYFTNIAQKNTMLISNLARFSYEKDSHLVVKGSATKSSIYLFKVNNGNTMAIC